MSWNCWAYQCHLKDGSQSSMHPCISIADAASFAMPEGQDLPTNAPDYGYRPFVPFTPAGPMRSIATQYNPHPSAWLANEYTQPIPAEQSAYSHGITSDDNFFSEVINSGCSQSKLLQTSDDQYVGRGGDQNPHRPEPYIRLHSDQLKCRWEGCRYPGVFSRETVLWRHIRTTHVSPDKFKCRECKRSFGRNDKLQEHVRSHLK